MEKPVEIIIAMARAKATSDGLLYRFISALMAKSPITTPVPEKMATHRQYAMFSLPKIRNMNIDEVEEKTIR